MGCKGGGAGRVYRREERQICCKVCWSFQTVGSERTHRPLQVTCCMAGVEAGDEAEQLEVKHRKETGRLPGSHWSACSQAASASGNW